MSLETAIAAAIEGAAETHTTIAWLHIAADALACAQMDPLLSAEMGEKLLRAEVVARMAVVELKEGL